MQLIKITSKQEVDHFIVTDSKDMQDAMFAIERFAQERRTPRISTGEHIKDPLLFSVHGDCSFKGYGTNGIIEFKAEVVQYRKYESQKCELI